MLTKRLTRSPLRTNAIVELRAYASGQLGAYGGIPKANIKRIYSELEPCELAGHTCKAKLTENFPTSEKIFSYDYPGGVDNTVRTASVNQRYIDLEQLLK